MSQLLLGVGMAWALQKRFKEMSVLHTESVEAAHAEHRAQSASKVISGQVATSTSIRRMQQAKMQDDADALNQDLPKQDKESLLQSNTHLLAQQSNFDQAQASTNTPMQGVMLDHYRM